MRPFVCRLVPLEQGRPTWLHLVPYGHWDGHHSKRPVNITTEGGAQILANFQKRGIKLVVDWEHQTLASMVNGQPAPAAGWIDQLELRNDGVWGHVDAWTARAAAQLDGDPPEYRYLSPVIELSSIDPRTGAPEGLWLSSVALTNVPFFAGELSPVVARGTRNMNLLTLLLSALELPPETTEDQAIEAVKSLKSLPKDEPKEDPVMAARAGLGEVVATKLGWDKKLPKDAAKIVAKALDHEGYVSETEALTLRARIAELEAAEGGEGIARLVARGVETGKLTPAFKGHFEALAKRDVAAATAWLDSAPVIIPNGVQVVKGKRVSDELSPTEALACKNLGMDPKAYAKARTTV